MRKTIIVLIALLLCVALNAGAKPNPLDILKKNIEARGGAEKLDAVKSSKVVFNVTMEQDGQKMNMTTTVFSQDPDMNRTEMDFGGIKQIQGSNGKVKWMSGMQGTKIMDDKETLNELTVSSAWKNRDYLNPESDMFKVKYKGEKKIDGKKCDYLIITNKLNSNKQKKYFDKSTHLLAKLV